MLYKSWLYSLPKKKYKKPKAGKPKPLSRLQKYANKLNLDLPKSEIWFQKLFENENFNTLFFYNKPIGKYIPDVVSFKHKVIIEIDGSIHETDIQKFKDKLKTDYFINRGYTVFRIKAYSMNSYNEVLLKLKELLIT